MVSACASVQLVWQRCGATLAPCAVVELQPTQNRRGGWTQVSHQADLIQADLVLAGGAGWGIHSPARVWLPQVPNRLWRTGN